MKKNEIARGSLYTAKVSGKKVTVRVDAIRIRQSGYGPTSRDVTIYDVTNLSTKKRLVFRSAQRFISKYRYETPKPAVGKDALPPAESRKVLDEPREDEQGPDPTVSASTRSTTTSVESGCPSVQKMIPGLATSGLGARLRAQKAVEDTAPHVIVEARAGTGKTTTLVEGLKILKGIESSRLVPSPQQKAVWDAIAQSRDSAKTVCFACFNNSIFRELEKRVPAGCTATTMHRMGNKAVLQAFPELARFDLDKANYVIPDIIAEILGKDLWELKRTKPVVLKATEQLVSLCKMNLVGFESLGPERNREDLADLAAAYDVDLNGQSGEVFALVPQVLEKCKTPKGRYNFDDMIWLPIVLNLPMVQYDLLLVDEAQDLNRCQQALARRAGKRLILCGDPKQAIYGFAGADGISMKRLEQELSATDRGCVHLPLTVTRRCGKAIVKEAQQYVPDFSAFETNPEGKITTLSIKQGSADDYRKSVDDGNMVLSRVNAPLVSECFRFLRAGRKANIQGRDVGQGLISTIKRCLKAKDEGELAMHTVEALIGAVGEWLHVEERKENAKRNPSESRLIALQDRHDCIVCFTEGAKTAQDVVAKVNAIFTDDKNGTGIRLSSIHKAKGLEAKRVFLLRTKDAPVPHPMAKTPAAKEQEINLLYVAITRAIEELIYVTD